MRLCDRVAMVALHIESHSGMAMSMMVLFSSGRCRDGGLVCISGKSGDWRDIQIADAFDDTK